MAYKKKEKYNLDGVEYDIATKGKVKDLENDMTDAEYAEYVSLKALEEANARNLAQVLAANYAEVGPAQHVPQQL